MIQESKALADKLVRANTPPRMQEMDTLLSYVEGRQYDGRPGWFTTDVPLWERAPCIVYQLVQTAIRSFRDLILGDGKFPGITSRPEEDDSEFDDSELGEDKSKSLDRFMVELMRQSRFRRVCKEMLSGAMGSRSSVCVMSIRNGKVFAETNPAKWSTPESDNDGAVTKLTIQYPYEETYQVRGQWLTRAMLYKRTIDATSDATYFPVEAREDGQEPSGWSIDPSKSQAHGLGFCPVIWYAFDRGCAVQGTVDGRAIHEGILDEVEAHDFAISQRHRAALFCGDPQIIETGVDTDENIGDRGREANVATRDGGKANSANPVIGFWSGGRGGTKPARKKSPGTTWQYVNDAAKVYYLSLDAGALEAIDRNAHDLRQKLAETLAVVFMDPENVKFAATVSGKALDTLRQRQYDRCDDIRDDFGDGFILPALGMMLRMVLTAQGRVNIKGVDIVKQFADVLFLDGVWFAPSLTLKWPQYNKPGADDEQLTVATTTAARNAGLITRRAAVEKVASIFGIENVDAAMDALEAEDAAQSDKQLTLEHAMNSLANGSETPPSGGKDKKTNPRIGSGAAAMAKTPPI